MSNTITMEGGNFSTIPNELLNNASISLSAKGMYVFMRGKPAAWNFTIRSMAKQLKEGETAISNALNELKKYGWISYAKLSNGKGVYHLFWTASAETQEDPNQGNHDKAEPKPEKPNQGYPMKGKPTRISKKEPIVRNIDNKTPNPIRGSADAPDEHSEKTKSAKRNIPFERITDLFNKILPELPAVILINKSRESAIRSRWNEHPAHQSLEFWEDLFNDVRKSDFLMGRVISERTFRCSFDWIIKPSNFVKVVEGNYIG